MSDSDEVLDVLVDFSKGLEALAVNLRRQLDGFSKLEKWNPDEIKWEEAEGFKGKYERSEDVNSIDFKNLIKDLKQHAGKLSRQGYFYWLFKNGSIVGRKKRGSEAKG